MAVTDTRTIGDYTAAVTIDGTTHYMLIQPGSASTAYKKITRNVLLGVTGQPMDISTSQNVTNKTLDNSNILTIRDDRFTLQDNVDTTKQAQFQLSGITTGTTRTYTLPNASSTLADIATAQTLTNKTLTAPVITNGSMTGTSITNDAIVGQSSATSGTVYGLSISSGTISSTGLASNAVATAKIADSAVTPAKLFTGTGSTWAWTSWTPTFSGFPQAIGNAVLDCKYIQIGKTVICRISITTGTTTTYAVVGTITGTLPVTAVSMTATTYIGNVRINTSTANPGIVRIASTTTFDIKSEGASATYLVEDQFSSTVPGTWGTGSLILGTFMYEAA
jgi:hypothetical protein